MGTVGWKDVMAAGTELMNEVMALLAGEPLGGAGKKRTADEAGLSTPGPGGRGNACVEGGGSARGSAGPRISILTKESQSDSRDRANYRNGF